MKNNIKISIAQMKPVPMNIKSNLETMENYIIDAKKAGSKIIIFPELCVSGYVIGDRFEYEDFINELQEANNKIKLMSNGITIVWGNVVSDNNKIGEDGRVRKYNAALIASDGEYVSNGVLHGYMPKTNLPKYRVFDDARHFYPSYKLADEMGIDMEDFIQPFKIKIDDAEYNIALTVCEDLWEDEYNNKLSHLYKNKNVDLLIDISASPWTLNKWKARERMLLKRVKDSNTSILYVNCVGLQNNGKNLIWFDGGSSYVDKNIGITFRAKVNECGLFNYIIGDKASDNVENVNEIKELYDALISAMREFYSPFKKVVIGLSGGIDSALTLGLLSAAISRDKILTINMPTRYNSSTTKRLASECAKNFGVDYIIIPIDELYENQVKILENVTSSQLLTLTKENIQSRIRGQQLASMAAHYNGVFTNNGNKTEVALNYFTLYGDGAGAAAFLGDIWKGQVYELAKYINSINDTELIPKEMIDLIPSAELSEDQNIDEGKGDPIYYEYHDKLLKLFIENRISITDIMREYKNANLDNYLGLLNGTVNKHFKNDTEFISDLKWAWSACNTEYKRVQLPPVFLTSRRAFGYDRRDTISAPFISEEFEKYIISQNN